MPVIDHLFVYGTLRRDHGHPMHQVLARFAQSLGRATLAARLYDVGPYPAAVPATAAHERVVGELYRLAKPDRVLPRLDAYEDVPREYRRARAAVMLEGGGAVEAWVYLYNRATRGLRVIDTGDYLHR